MRMKILDSTTIWNRIRILNENSIRLFIEKYSFLLLPTFCLGDKLFIEEIGIDNLIDSSDVNVISLWLDELD